MENSKEKVRYSVKSSYESHLNWDLVDEKKPFESDYEEGIKQALCGGKELAGYS